MNIWRLGDRVINKDKIDDMINKMLHFRSMGMTQTEVAERLGVDRTLICRLENLGEIRKGKKLAVVGFPIKNKKQLHDLLVAEGIDFIFLLTEEERWHFIQEKSALELLNTLMDLISMAHSFDQIIVISSDKWLKLLASVLDRELVGFHIGESPMQEDVYVEPKELLQLVRSVKMRDQDKKADWKG